MFVVKEKRAIWFWRIEKCCKMVLATCSGSLAPGMTGRSCRKSPPKTSTLPPKALESPVRSRSKRSTQSKAARGTMDASSQRTRTARLKTSARGSWARMLDVAANLGMSMGKPNSECAVAPPGSNCAAIPDMAQAREILPVLRTECIKASYRKVFPEPPGPST